MYCARGAYAASDTIESGSNYMTVRMKKVKKYTIEILLIFALSLSVILTGCAGRKASPEDMNISEAESEAETTVEAEAEKVETTEEETEALTETESEPESSIEETEVAAEVDASQDMSTSQLSSESEAIYLDENWQYSDFTVVHNDPAILYRAQNNRKDIIIGVDAGHGTKGAEGMKIYCHPDKSPKTTGGSTAAGATMANAQSGGMTFNDGTGEATMTLKVARLFRDRLLEDGYDVLMLRDEDRVELDLMSRTVIANNMADCHISIHFDGDGLGYDKGAFYIAVPDGIKNMSPVKETWELDDRLGAQLVEGLGASGIKIYGNGTMKIDLTQTSFSTIPSVDLELGNQATLVNDELASKYVEGMMLGVDSFFAQR